MEPLLTALLQVREELRKTSGRRVPLLVKLSPDLEHSNLASTAALLKSLSIDGVIATNTTIARDAIQDDPLGRESGGLSGAPLHAAALLTVMNLRSCLGASCPLIGVGGIDSVDSGLAMHEAGADLIQLYTGLIYQGSGLVKPIARALAGVRP